jgi:putative endonuclease
MSAPKPDRNRAARSASRGNAPWRVYMLRCADQTLYTGIAKDLHARVALHNEGRGAKYTRSRRPAVLAYWEEAPDRSAAQRREHEIRRLPVAKKRALCAGMRIRGSEPPLAARILVPRERRVRSDKKKGKAE